MNDIPVKYILKESPNFRDLGGYRNREGKYIRQSGGRGQYGHAIIKVESNERGKGIEIENKIVGGAIPKEYIPAVINGLNEAVAGGVLAGYPVVDLKIQIVDGTPFADAGTSEALLVWARPKLLNDLGSRIQHARTDAPGRESCELWV